MTAATVFPLTWPKTIPRVKHRQSSQFKTVLSTALKNVESSLRLFAGDSGKPLAALVISSNVSLGVQKPSDPGVAVWFTWDGLQVCIPVDRYHKVEENLQAIHHILEARRVELRHGTLALVHASLAGFKALPPPPGSMWWEVLGVEPSATAMIIEAAFKKLASQHHPDKGGTTEMMAKLNKARQEAGLQ